MDEEGLIFPLGLALRFWDDFTTEGQEEINFEGRAWQNGLLYSFGTITGNETDLQAECFDWEDDDIWDNCYFDLARLADCLSFSEGQTGVGRTLYNECPGGEGGGCSSTDAGENHSITTSSIGKSDVDWVGYANCNTSAYYADDGSDYGIFNKKRARCTSSTSFVYEGYDGSTPWRTYASGSCTAGYVCDYSIDEQEVTSELGTIPSPCSVLTNKCNGTITVNSQELSGNPINGSYVYLNNQLK